MIRENESGIEEKISIEELEKSLNPESFIPVVLSVKKPKTLYVFVFSARVSDDEGERTFAIVMNASSWEEATEIDYFITNVPAKKVTPQWVVETQYFSGNGERGTGNGELGTGNWVGGGWGFKPRPNTDAGLGLNSRFSPPEFQRFHPNRERGK